MKLLFTKYATACSLLLLLLFASCTKEGLIGPEGEEGPAGENGTGTGGGGTSTRILTYYTPPTATFTWEATTGGNYRLKYSVATRSGYTITLPDSVTKHIEEGALVIYADQGEDNQHYWQQLQVEPVMFYAIFSYMYTIEKVAGVGYRFSFPTIGTPKTNFKQLKFVVIPKTEVGVIQGEL
jgi:hypothetical protein